MSRRGARWVTIAALATTLAAALGLMLGHAKRAGATFPGEDGLIAFSRITEDPDGNGFCTSIWSATPAGTNSRQLSGGCSFDEEPSWSADGRRIAFVQDERIYTMSKRGKDFERVTKGKRFQGKRFRDHNPAWSPDGDRIVFWRTSGVKGFSIYTVRPNGNDLRPVLPQPSGLEEFDPVYSPDGAFIAFAASDADGKEAIYRVRSDGTDLQAVTAPGRDVQEPDWSPDGERIVFSGQKGGFELFSVHADGTGLDKLTNNSGDPFSPVYSPDGSRIAFSNSGELSVIPAGGGKPKTILKKKTKFGDVEPSWQAK